MRTSRVSRRGLLKAAGCALLVGCRRALSPEQQIRRLLDQLETAVEEQDVAAVRQGLSPSFRGPDELDRAGALGLLQLRLRRSPPHLLVRVDQLEVTGDGLGHVQLLVAMAALPISGPEALPHLEADLYRFDLQLAREDGRYRVRAATWERASAW